MLAPISVAVTGAAGNIGYALLPLLASGHVFGSDRPIELRLLEIPQALSQLVGVKMELIDAAYPLVTSIVCTSDPTEALRGVDVAILVGGYPRKEGMQRKDLIQANTHIFQAMGRALNQVASPNVKVLCVANPANTNCLVVIQQCITRIPAKNICALTHLDFTRAKAVLAERLGASVKDVKNVIIWGNHSTTQFPDATSDGYMITKWGGKLPLCEILSEDITWLQHEFLATVRERGKVVIDQRGKSSAMSAAQATADCLRTWLVTGTQKGETMSMAVYNDVGYYKVENGLVFSFPCECRNGEWMVKQGIELDLFARQQLKLTERELIEEKLAAMEVLAPSKL
jgi:malate dehydrogenase